MPEINYQEIITTFNTYISKLERGCIYIAHEMRNENKEILQEIANFAEGIEWLIIMSRELKNVEIMPFLEEEKLVNYLKEITEAIQREDFYLVADLFEYEIAEYFKNPVLIEG